MRSTLNEEQVMALFSTCSKECDVLIGLLKLAVPNWDRVEYILEGKPHIGEGGWINKLALDFWSLLSMEWVDTGKFGL
jgi:hypothetical protein